MKRPFADIPSMKRGIGYEQTNAALDTMAGYLNKLMQKDNFLLMTFCIVAGMTVADIGILNFIGGLTLSFMFIIYPIYWLLNGKGDK